MSLTLSTWHLQSLKRVLLVGRITRPQIFRKKLRPAFHRVCSAPLRVEPLVQQEKAVDPCTNSGVISGPCRHPQWSRGWAEDPAPPARTPAQQGTSPASSQVSEPHHSTLEKLGLCLSLARKRGGGGQWWGREWGSGNSQNDAQVVLSDKWCLTRPAYLPCRCQSCS